MTQQTGKLVAVLFLVARLCPAQDGDWRPEDERPRFWNSMSGVYLAEFGGALAGGLLAPAGLVLLDAAGESSTVLSISEPAASLIGGAAIALAPACAALCATRVGSLKRQRGSFLPALAGAGVGGIAGYGLSYGVSVWVLKNPGDDNPAWLSAPLTALGLGLGAVAGYNWRAVCGCEQLFGARLLPPDVGLVSAEADHGRAVLGAKARLVGVRI